MSTHATRGLRKYVWTGLPGDMMQLVFDHEPASEDNMSARQSWKAVCRQWRHQHRVWVGVFYTAGRNFSQQQMQRIALDGDMTPVVHGLGKYLSVVEVQLSGCRKLFDCVRAQPSACAVEYFASMKTKAECLGRIGGIQALQCAMLRHGGDSTLCMYGMMALADLSWYPSNQAIFNRELVHETAIYILRRHPRNSIIETQGLVALQIKTNDHEIFAKKLAAVTCIIRRNHAGNIELLNAALLALKKIIADDTDECGVRVVPHEHIHAILLCIKRHTDNRELGDRHTVALACCILGRLATRTCNVHGIVAHGGKSVLSDALLIYSANQSVTALAQQCLDLLF